MNTAKHTPGPWVVMNGSLDVWNASETRRITAHPWIDKDEESAANAALIAAAPELLAALENILPLYEQSLRARGYDEETIDSGKCGQARAAIAKAKGDQS